MIRPMTKSPPMTNLRKAGDDVAGSLLAFAAARQDQAGGGDVQRQAAGSSRSAARSGTPRNRADAGSTARPSGSTPTARSRRRDPGRSRIGGIGRNRIVSMTTMPAAKKASAPRRRGMEGRQLSVSAMSHRRQRSGVADLPGKAYAGVAAAAASEPVRSRARSANKTISVKVDRCAPMKEPETATTSER